jgi:hypothetical protein
VLFEVCGSFKATAACSGAVTSAHASAALGKMDTFHLLEQQASFCEACDASLAEGETVGPELPAAGLPLNSPANAVPQPGAQRCGQLSLGAIELSRAAPGEGEGFGFFPSPLGGGWPMSGAFTSRRWTGEASLRGQHIPGLGYARHP